MLLFGLQVTTTRQLQTAKCVGGALSESKEVAVQTIPKEDATARDKTGRQLHRQRPVAGTGDVLAQLLFVWREDANAASAARNGHIPLLRIGRGFDGGVGEQDVIDRLALRSIRRDGV